MSKREEKSKKEVEERVSLWKLPKKIPSFNLKQKGAIERERNKLISSSYIIESENGKKIIFSGGYKVFLYIVYIEGNRDNILKRILKQRSWKQYEEFLKIRERERLFGFIGRLDNPHAFEDKNCKIILDKIEKQTQGEKMKTEYEKRIIEEYNKGFHLFWNAKLHIVNHNCKPFDNFINLRKWFDFHNKQIFEAIDKSKEFTIKEFLEYIEKLNNWSLMGEWTPEQLLAIQWVIEKLKKKYEGEK
jgi:hypothetical protein